MVAVRTEDACTFVDSEWAPELSCGWFSIIICKTGFRAQLRNKGMYVYVIRSGTLYNDPPE